MHQFICNICETACSAEVLDRELPTCPTCLSNVRFRWIVHALSVALFGQSLPLRKFPRRKEIRGMGMSDPLPIADVLAGRFTYQNTFFHAEPRFDIMAAAGEDQFDFIIASEVFEHVPSPVQSAFNNLERLLKPGGVAVFSCPWETDGDTLEHFPHLCDSQLVQLRTGWVLLNRREDGRLETYEDLVFHGGPGSTLERRVFSHDGLMANFRAAGFGEITMAEDYPKWGIVELPWSRGFVLRKRADSLR